MNEPLVEPQSTAGSSSGVWDIFDRASWKPVANIDTRLIPASPGVYAWRRDREAIYVGVAKTSLRQRLRAHLVTGPDMSRSTLRASVAAEQLGVSRQTARARPPQLTAEQAAVVDEWLRGCEVAWVAQGSPYTAVDLEARLLRQHKPKLNRAG